MFCGCFFVNKLLTSRLGLGLVKKQRTFEENDASVIRWVIILGLLAIASILSVQSYWVLKAWDVEEREFHQSVSIALRQTAEKLADFHQFVLPAKGLIKQLSSNYYVVNLENIIDPQELEFHLQEELERAGLVLDFEYAIFDCHSDEMVYGKYCKIQTGEKLKPSQEMRAYKDFTYYFGVRFPTRTNFMARQMNYSLIFSGILLLAVAFFGYAIWVILKQRRHSGLTKEFINNMTHELKTPITTTRIALNVLQNAPAVQQDARLKRYTSILGMQVDRLHQQSERILQLVRMDKKGFELQLEKTDIRTLLLTVAESMQLEAESKGGTLDCLVTNYPVYAMTDPVHSLNVFYNLVDNAIKYSGDTIRITIRMEHTDKDILVFVSDTGKGIPQKHHKAIFEQFYRIPTGNEHSVKGYGLGLHYVKKICQTQHWKITLESILGKGSTFRLQIPKL